MFTLAVECIIQQQQVSLFLWIINEYYTFFANIITIVNIIIIEIPNIESSSMLLTMLGAVWQHEIILTSVCLPRYI